jgi:hypothetical protein
MSSDTRLVLGIALLVLGLISPAGTFLVAATDWPTSVKTLLGGILLFGLEIMAIPAAALMGKENFDRIVSAAKRLLKSMKPEALRDRPRTVRRSAAVRVDRELRSGMAAAGLRRAGVGQPGA